MKNIELFLETSSLHGLTLISITRKYVRLFWVLVVISGFTGAGVIIYTSFQTWNESPIKTTIENLPIKKLGFPKVTICPPRNTYTDLNYDLINSQKMTIDNETRNKLTSFAMDELLDIFHDELMTNVSKLRDNDRYYNWYHGYAEISIPSQSHGLPTYPDTDLYYHVHTYASNGLISTKHFGEKFDSKKVDAEICYVIYIHSTENITSNRNVSLHVEIEKNLMSSDVVELYNGNSIINANFMNVTPPNKDISFLFTRKVSQEQIINKVRITNNNSQYYTFIHDFIISYLFQGTE